MHGGRHFKTFSAVVGGMKVQSAQSLSSGNSLGEKKEMPISQTHGRQTNHHSSVTAMYTRFHLDVASTLRLTGTSLCNRSSGFFPFAQWKSNLSGTRWNFQFYPASLWLPRCDFYIPSVYQFLSVWKRQNSDLVERGKLVKNLPTRWRFFPKTWWEYRCHWVCYRVLFDFLLPNDVCLIH